MKLSIKWLVPDPYCPTCKAYMEDRVGAYVELDGVWISTYHADWCGGITHGHLSKEKILINLIEDELGYYYEESTELNLAHHYNDQRKIP